MYTIYWHYLRAPWEAAVLWTRLVSTISKESSQHPLCGLMTSSILSVYTPEGLDATPKMVNARASRIANKNDLEGTVAQTRPSPLELYWRNGPYYWGYVAPFR